ncbi:arabinogalactan protein 23-like [Prunus dulcis]|nr:arabinogalactan protein 23-like [Prunus dulcis]
MEMKKIVCAVLFAAASVSAVMAHEGHAYTQSPSPAPAPGPGGAANDASASLPVLGSVVGASIVSFIAYYMQ